MQSAKKPRELCLGGSFNPPHAGHLITARAAAEAGGFDRVRLIVAGRSPHKVADRDVAPAGVRVAMTRAAVDGDPLFLVDDRELRRDGPSFTADTAEALQRERGEGPIHWLIGVDLLSGLPTWHRAAELTADPPTLVQFVVMARGGHRVDAATLPASVQHLAAAIVEVPRVEISSSDIRRRLREGRPIRYLVPPTVEEMARSVYPSGA